MHNIKTQLLLSGFFCLFAFNHTAVGQISLEFSNGASTGTTFNANVGTTQTISVVAVETTPGTVLSSTGLLGFGFDVNASATAGTAASLVDFTGNPGFILAPEDTVTPSSATIQRNVLDLAGGGAGVAGTSVPLGDFEISVTAPGSTVFTFEDPSDLTVNFGGFLTPLDSIIFGSGSPSFTINAINTVPEPSGAALIGLSMLASTIRRKRICS